MNIPRIQELADFIETQTAIPFAFMRHEDCIMGFHERMLGVEPGTISDIHHATALDLAPQQAEWLFYGGFPTSTREDAVNVLRELAKTGDVEWPVRDISLLDAVGGEEPATA
jgi:hypothetical protein